VEQQQRVEGTLIVTGCKVGQGAGTCVESVPLLNENLAQGHDPATATFE